MDATWRELVDESHSASVGYLLHCAIDACKTLQRQAF